MTTFPVEADDLPKVPVLGSTVHLVGLDEAAHIILGWAETPAPGSAKVAIAFNPERSVKAQRDPRVAEALLEADLRFPDGVGVVWAARQRGAVRRRFSVVRSCPGVVCGT